MVLDSDFKWIFVGGRNEAGKSTIAASIALQLSKIKNRVLLISLDPTESLNAIFKTKFNDLPKHIPGSKTLWVMYSYFKYNSPIGEIETSALANIFANIMIDDFDVVVFDMYSIKSTVSLFEITMKSAARLNSSSIESIISLFESFIFDTRKITSLLRQTTKRLKNNKETAFVICLHPNYWPLLDTENLYQYLIEEKISIPYMIINKIYEKEESSCQRCVWFGSRQQDFIKNIYDLYQDIEIVKIPYLYDEIAGTDSLQSIIDYMQPLFSSKIQEK
ncbi:Anion-transporting ATPase family protein [Trichomonas vaginalis G3]|uniref:Anion-transporting ATPase family protein n=1 Tax=Trichomonas vaginalis (strain ATCC PRA-98 / G3) TaxID=412133 RepID=A2DYZ3_TRIV3|nr:ATPase protein [Trichomonas vaginalis G3]EAY14404.1 Anion-transporting ATPase family protein [Trichomonas vaginalis G3]KAI5501237.1 ATPase protein [Trichomonas vaginalis G3]|eukprot:XP_001326627.1 Anion-transporting ATPase family protein [Trichomonas vaginalis G3]